MPDSEKSILIIGPYPPPFGGISGHIANFVPDLLKHGFKVCVISYGNKNETLQKDGLTVFRVNLKTKLYKLLKINNIYRNLLCFVMLCRYKINIRDILREMVRVDIIAGILKDQKIQLISVYSIVNGYGIPALRKVWKVKIPFILTIYATIYEEFSFYSAHSSLTRSLLGLCDKVTASSKYSARSVELLGIDSSAIEPVYYGVDLTNFSPGLDKFRIRREIGISESSKILLFVGRMLEEMGLDVILEIIPMIFSQREDVVMIIVGPEGKLTPEAQELQEKYKNRVYVRLDIPFNLLPYYYSACDVLLAPTRGKHASMGMSIKEAMASGRSVIATDAPGIREAVIPGETGVLVPADDDNKVCPDSLLEAVLTLLDKPRERELMGGNARKRAEELFDKLSTSKKMVGIFESLLNKSNDPIDARDAG
jgi:glycosyltransferase involved in cell wall biosynthesis